MSIQNQKFAASEPSADRAVAESIDTQDVLVLPHVPPTLLGNILLHMNEDERAVALQRRLVPIAWLPHQTLFATAAYGDAFVLPPQGKIVARIAPQEFDAAVRKFLAPKIAADAIGSLKTQSPDFSAHERLSPNQKVIGLAVVIGLVAALFLIPHVYIYHLFGMSFTALFVSMVWLRLLATTERHVREKPVPEMDDAALPVYSVLVPVFRETSVLPQLIAALSRLSYPAAKLDIKLILEETDTRMQRAVARLNLPPQFQVLVVPPGKPQTKPRALNFALQFARGSLLTIYDAEDVPEPMQLRIAARKFAKADGDMACFQAELAFYNPNENWLTRQFTIEYAILFRVILPTLAKYHMPLPLGGTSNHFRTSVLRKVGGWDAYNVTEDADLGFRLARFGYQTATLPSITYEEANTQTRNWLNQRARWFKGFLQTWLVHMRGTADLVHEAGWSGLLSLQAAVLGVVISATLHPFFLVLTLVGIVAGGNTSQGFGLASGAMSCFYLSEFGIGVLVMMWSAVVALRRKRIGGWWLAIITMPGYWFLASAAGLMGVWQLLHDPFHWNKTRHGISKFNVKP